MSNSWASIEESIIEIAGINRNQRIFGRIVTRLKKRKMIGLTFANLLRFQKAVAGESMRAIEAIRDLQRIDKLDYLSRYKESEIDQLKSYPVGDAMRHIEFLEERSKSSSHNSIVIVSALIGAAIGMIGAFLLK